METIRASGPFHHPSNTIRRRGEKGTVCDAGGVSPHQALVFRSPSSVQQGQPGTSGMAPGQQKGQPGQPKGTTGQAGEQKQRQGREMQRQQDRPGAAERKGKPGTAGQAQDRQKQPRSGAQREQREPRTGAQQQRERRGTQQREGAGTRTETSGRGDVQAARLTTEQRTKIRNVVVSRNIRRVDNVNFSISVGTKVPRTVQLQPIPAEIVEIQPTWRRYRVILVSKQLVIIDPNTFEIVAIVSV